MRCFIRIEERISTSSERRSGELNEYEYEKYKYNIKYCSPSRVNTNSHVYIDTCHLSHQSEGNVYFYLL